MAVDQRSLNMRRYNEFIKTNSMTQNTQNSIQRRRATGAYNYVQENKNSDSVIVVAVFDKWNVGCVAHSDGMRHAFNGSSATNGHIYLHQFQMGERDQNMNAREHPVANKMPLVRRVAIFPPLPFPTYITV